MACLVGIADIISALFLYLSIADIIRTLLLYLSNVLYLYLFTGEQQERESLGIHFRQQLESVVTKIPH